MTLRHYRPLLAVTIGTLIFYTINRVVLLTPQYAPHYEGYHHSLEVVYLFFWLVSLVVLFAVIKVNQKSPDNTGYTYLAATMVQMGLCYLMLRPVLEAQEETSFEKINFFVVFLLFLTIETVITIRILNKKQ